MKPKPQIVPPRPVQKVTDDVVERLLRTVRGQFCGDLGNKEWFQHVPFVRRNVILWSARFVIGKGFTLPPERFEAVLQGVFSEIKRHGQTGQVRYWPGYLMKCVQDHWKHHWEEYYQEAKSVRSIAEAALVNSGKAAPVDRTLEALAMAHQALAGLRRKSRLAPKARQPDLFRA